MGSDLQRTEKVRTRKRHFSATIDKAKMKHSRFTQNHHKTTLWSRHLNDPAWVAGAQTHFGGADEAKPCSHVTTELDVQDLPRFRGDGNCCLFSAPAKAESDAIDLDLQGKKRYGADRKRRGAKAKPIVHPNSTSIILDTDRRITQKTPNELIDAIKDKCFYRHEGWWSYEFCHQKHVRQLHLEDNKPTQEFFMGIFDPVATADFNQKQSDATLLKDPRSKDASQRYHAHLYTNGTICDLTNRPRETEIRFVCSEPSVVISSIKEISTCKYAITVQCPMLCKHPMFQQERPLWHTIHCNEVTKDAAAASGEDLSKGAQMMMMMVTEDSAHYVT